MSRRRGGAVGRTGDRGGKRSKVREVETTTKSRKRKIRKRDSRLWSRRGGGTRRRRGGSWREEEKEEEEEEKEVRAPVSMCALLQFTCAILL